MLGQQFGRDLFAQLAHLGLFVVLFAQLLADGLQLLPEKEFPLAFIHVFFHGILQLSAHLHGRHALVQFAGHPVQQIGQGAGFQNLLLHPDLQVELGADQIGHVEGVGQAVDRGHQFLWQFGGADQFLELAADIVEQGLDVFVFHQLHGQFVHPGLEVGLALQDGIDGKLVRAAHQDLVGAFLGLVELVHITDHAHLVEIFRSQDVVIADLLLFAGYQTDEPVIEQYIVDQAL